MLREWLAQPVPERVDADEAYLAQFDRRAIAGRFAQMLNEIISRADAVATNESALMGLR
ncbi:hypothetical protein D3C72_2600130 [compost metagenome]